MRLISSLVLGLLLWSSLARADDRDYFLKALATTKAEILTCELRIAEYTSDRNFPTDLALAADGEMLLNLEHLDRRVDQLLQFNTELTLRLNTLHVRLYNLNGILADRQRDLHFKYFAAEGSFQPIFQNIRELNEATKRIWDHRRAALAQELLMLRHFSVELMQLRYAIHGFREQLLAAELLPAHSSVIRRSALEKITASNLLINTRLHQIRTLHR